jgi:hypothetical protein
MPERPGLTILLRITDGPVYAAECRHPADCWYSYEWSRKKRRSMIPVSIWSAKGEGRVRRDQKAGDDGK